MVCKRMMDLLNHSAPSWDMKRFLTITDQCLKCQSQTFACGVYCIHVLSSKSRRSGRVTKVHGAVAEAAAELCLRSALEIKNVSAWKIFHLSRVRLAAAGDKVRSVL